MEENLEKPITGKITRGLSIPKQSDWTCYLFGATPVDGIAWTPPEGGVPNRLIRVMSKLFFGCTWIKDKEKV